MTVQDLPLHRLVETGKLLLLKKVLSVIYKPLTKSIDLLTQKFLGANWLRVQPRAFVCMIAQAAGSFFDKVLKNNCQQVMDTAVIGAV